MLEELNGLTTCLERSEAEGDGERLESVDGSRRIPWNLPLSLNCPEAEDIEDIEESEDEEILFWSEAIAEGVGFLSEFTLLFIIFKTSKILFCNSK